MKVDFIVTIRVLGSFCVENIQIMSVDAMTSEALMTSKHIAWTDCYLLAGGLVAAFVSDSKIHLITLNVT